MKNIILYGAGRRGKKIAKMLKERGICIAGFLDSYISGGVIDTGGGVYPVFPLDAIEKDEWKVIISIADYKEALKVRKLLEGMEIITIEDVLQDTADSIVENNRKCIAEYHDSVMTDYYDEAETDKNLNIFWDKSSDFFKLFSTLNLNNVVELACGHGRHVTKYKQSAGNIVLVDILESNIVYCKKRFSGEKNLEYYVNNGHDLCELKSNNYSAVFSYDAMVHFEMIDIFEYLREIERILVLGGRALLHHSNNTEDYRITFSSGTGSRNYMSAQLFAYLANRAGLKVIDQKLIEWANVKNLDCITLLEK